MKYPEDLTFTAEFLKDNPITVRDTTLYKDVKKAIWNNHSQGLYHYRCAATWYEFKENELDVLEALRAEGFDVIINTASNVALISKPMSEWAYINGSILVEVPGKTQEEKDKVVANSHKYQGTKVLCARSISYASGLRGAT